MPFGPVIIAPINDPAHPYYGWDEHKSVNNSRKMVNGVPAFTVNKTEWVNPQTGVRLVSLKSQTLAEARGKPNTALPVDVQKASLYHEYGGKRQINAETLYLLTPKYPVRHRIAAKLFGLPVANLNRTPLTDLPAQRSQVNHKVQQQLIPEHLLYNEIPLSSTLLPKRLSKKPAKLPYNFVDWRMNWEKWLGKMPYAPPEKMDARSTWERLRRRPPILINHPALEKARQLPQQLALELPASQLNHVRTILPRNRWVPGSRPLVMPFTEIRANDLPSSRDLVSDWGRFKAFRQLQTPKAWARHMTSPVKPPNWLIPLHQQWLAWVTGRGQEAKDILLEIYQRNPELFSPITPG